MPPLTRAALVATAIAIGSPALANGVPNFGFTGNYAEPNWASTTSALGLAGASIPTPDYARLSSWSSRGRGSYADLLTRATASGPVSFEWSFSRIGGPRQGAAAFGFILNEYRTMLANGPSTSGVASFAVKAGDTFGWYIRSAPLPGSIYVTGTIRKFQAPAPAPAPGPLPLLGVAAMFRASRRLRSRIG